MTTRDLPAFTKALGLIAAACGGRRLTSDLIEAYFHLLEELPIDPLCRGFERFARSAETGRRFPAPKELRAWVTATSTHAGLSADQETRIRAHVSAAMDLWERDGRIGSARTTFELAWQSALVTDGVRGDIRPRHREAAWQLWLAHGATAGNAPEYTDIDAETILRETAAKPLTNVHPALEARRQADGGARLLHGVFGSMLRAIAERRTAAATRGRGQPIETVEAACARGDCQYANPHAAKPDWTKTCPGHHGNAQCPRRIRWGEIHERSRDREPGEDG